MIFSKVAEVLKALSDFFIALDEAIDEMLDMFVTELKKQIVERLADIPKAVSNDKPRKRPPTKVVPNTRRVLQSISTAARMRFYVSVTGG